MRHSVVQRLLLAQLIAVGLIGLVEIPAIQAASLKSNPSSNVGRAESQSLGLKLRRLPDSFELVVVGTGPSPLLTQTSRAGEWLGTLSFATPRARVVRPRLFSLPEAGIESVSLSGGGTQFNLSVKGLNGITYSSAEVFADGNDLILKFPLPAAVVTQTGRPNVLQPGTVPASKYEPPLQPRAVAPPLGDMAVGSMVLRNQSFVKALGPKVTLTLKNAPAKDSLMAIARMGGYGFIFVDDKAASASSSSIQTANSESLGGPLVTLSFINEKYDQVLNSILLASGFQGKLDGRMLFVGRNVLGKTFGPQVSKTYRMNQVKAGGAADYLATLGAQMRKTNTITSTTATSSGSSDAAGNSGSSSSVASKGSSTAVTGKSTVIETYGASVGPLVGVSGTTDSRLNTVTLLGDSALVALAENYLRQIDLRQRQVAVKVQILNIDLENSTTINSDFSAMAGNAFLVNQGGRAYMNFGVYKPGGTNGTGIIQDGTPILNPGTYNGAGEGSGYSQPQNSFYSYVQAAIKTNNLKTLAQPTLLVQEGQKASVKTATSVITGVNSTEAANGSVQLVNVREDAGLILDLLVNKIDDNGFITLNLNPTISVPQDAGRQQGVQIFNITQRSLSSGDVRLRDGQTLVVTGVISETDIAAVTKWPILGDIPLIGQLFRNSANTRTKSELVILVTPQIVDDASGGVYGYGYRPISQASKNIIRTQN